MRLLNAGRAFSLGLLLGIIAGPVSAATYYLSPTGNDGYSGTATRPWKTIQKAANSSAPGDLILLNDGDYVGGGRHRTSGTADAPITYQAIHPGKAIVRGDLTTIDEAFTIYEADYVNVIGLTFHKGKRLGLWVCTSNHVTVRYCDARFNGVTGIFTSYSDDVTLEYNKCHGSGEQHGIYVSNSGNRPVVRYNTCYNNPRAGIQLNGDGSFLRPILGTAGDGIIEGAVVEGNVVYGNGSQGAAGLNLMAVRNGRIANNLIYNNKSGGIAMSDDADGLDFGCKDNLIVHNTIYFRSTEGRWCIALSNGSTGNTILNNVLWGGYRGAYQFDNTVAFTADYNVVREKSDVGMATNPDTGQFYTLTEWRTLTGNDLHSMKSDPRFVSVSTPYNFRLAASSPAIDRATDLSALTELTTDMDGNVRVLGDRADLGCYEGGFSPAVPTSLVATLSATSVALTWKASSVGSTYTVKRALSPTGPFEVIAQGLTKPSFTNTNLLAGLTYSYCVTATNGGLESSNSKVVSILVP